jgi:RNA polymerase sigma-70 factor, ECF subfamily
MPVPQALEPPIDRPERRSVEQLFASHGPTVARWAQRLGGPGVDAEDVLQEVFLVVQQRRPTDAGAAKLSTWLYQTTLNIVYQHRRRAKLRRWLGLAYGEVIEQLVTRGPVPLEDIEQRELRALANQVLDGMSDRYRTVFVLFEVEQLSGIQIAELMGAKVETVWVWLHRARTDFFRKLRQLETA